MAQDRRRRDEDGEGKRSQVRRLPLHRHPRQGATRHGAGVGIRRRQVHRRPCFDGSSIAGWKGIEASDMLLMPDPSTAIIDPFFDEPTLILDLRRARARRRQAYERDPRSLAKRAEAYLKSSGIADAAFFGPEPEFFIFDSVRWQSTCRAPSCKIDSEEAPWNTGQGIRGRQHRATGRRSRAATSRSRRSTRCRTCAPRCA